jgi:hypothetical protein
MHHDLSRPRDIVLAAVAPGRRKGEGPGPGQYWRAARTVLGPREEIRPTPGFTGRAGELVKIGNVLREGQTAAVYGLSGVGKSVLAHEYAYRSREEYAGVWWLNAARAKDSKTWDGLEAGLVELGSIFIRGLDQVQDRAAAARQALDFIAGGGFAKPWLLVYDNVDDTAVLRQWGSSDNVRVLATSRLGPWPAGVARIEVQEWPMPEAVDYLRRQSGRGDLTAAVAEAIATALGRLPLALSHAAAYLGENENATAARYLAAIIEHMREAPESAEYDRAVFATFREQIETAEARAPGARAVLSLAAFFAPDNIPEELFAQAAAHYPADLAEVAADSLAGPFLQRRAVAATASSSRAVPRSRSARPDRVMGEAIGNRPGLGTGTSFARACHRPRSPGPRAAHAGRRLDGG